VTAPATTRPPRRSLGRAAFLIGSLTMLSSAIGFGRQLVFAHTVRAGCIGTAYTTANMVPNIIYDVVLGGALTAAVVPVLAANAESEQTRRQISAALLTWTVLLLAPVSILVVLLSGPLASVLLVSTAGCPRDTMVTDASRMLMVFAPQILLYGLAVVLYGILQAHRRFTAPALAPVLSSIVVIGAYWWFGAAGGKYFKDVAALPVGAQLILALGTTAGVAALVVTPLLPVARLRLRMRPTLRFPDGVGARVRSLALAGLVTLIAEDASTVVVIVLANLHGGSGALVLYNWAWAVFFLPYAVLAVPIATSAFPELSEHAGQDGPGFDQTSATSTRAVLVASWLGAAGMAGVCIPLSRLFGSYTGGGGHQLAISFALFAPGLVGYGLVANLSRVLYACGRNRAALLAVSAGWVIVIVADLGLVPFVPSSWVVPVLGAGTSIGLSCAGVALLMLVGRARGSAALHGCSRAALAGLAAALVAAAAGWGISVALPAGGFLPNVGVTLLASAAVLAVFLAVVAVADGGDLRAVLRRGR
jgi:putative peptidoglycan lipid II flippase